MLFTKRFWVYRFDTLFKSYTSLLNFIPWGVGGFLYLSILEISRLKFKNPLIDTKIFSSVPFYIPLLLLFIVSVLLVFVIAYFSRRRNVLGFEFRELNIHTYLLFCLPIIAQILFVTVFYAFDYLLIAVAFGLGAFVFEYLFGRMCVFFISKKLWHYTYCTFDNNHLTPLSILPFAAGDFYFWSISLIISNL